MKNKYKLLALSGTALFCAAALHEKLTVRRYKISSGKINEQVRLMILSDLHSVVYGKGQRDLFYMIKKQKPDVILLAGDMVDNRIPAMGAKELFSKIGREYPCYYVCGNHEARCKNLTAVKNLVRSYGITVLEGNGEIVEIKGQKLRICGVDDPERFMALTRKCYNVSGKWISQLRKCDEDTGDSIYSILISHRPELAGHYMNTSFDLVAAGHAHGGQVRVPGLVNGLYAPNQGLFPEYAGGRYYLDGTTMIVSRGLAKGRLPRVFNPQELVVVDLLKGCR